VQTNRWSKWIVNLNRKRSVTNFTAILIVIYKVCAWFLSIKYQQNATQYPRIVQLLALPLPSLRSRTHGCSMRQSQEVKPHTQRHLACERQTKPSDVGFSRTEGSAGTSVMSSNILRYISAFCCGDCTGLAYRESAAPLCLHFLTYRIKWKACEITCVRFPARARGSFLFHKFQISSGAHQAPYSTGVGGGPFSRGKQMRLEVDPSPPSSGKVKNEWRYTSTPRICFHGVDRHYFAILQLCSDFCGR
jgi:hypothetical protein